VPWEQGARRRARRRADATLAGGGPPAADLGRGWWLCRWTQPRRWLLSAAAGALDNVGLVGCCWRSRAAKEVAGVHSAPVTAEAAVALQLSLGLARRVGAAAPGPPPAGGAAPWLRPSPPGDAAAPVAADRERREMVAGWRLKANKEWSLGACCDYR
jgi:hypothetical protein